MDGSWREETVRSPHIPLGGQHLARGIEGKEGRIAKVDGAPGKIPGRGNPGLGTVVFQIPRGRSGATDPRPFVGSNHQNSMETCKGPAAPERTLSWIDHDERAGIARHWIGVRAVLHFQSVAKRSGVLAGTSQQVNIVLADGNNDSPRRAIRPV